MSEMIALHGLTKRFGPLVAVDHITMSVPKGQVLGFLGPNGAGKSTTMKMVTGFMPPTEGTAVVCGHDVVTDPIEVKRRIGYLPEGAPTYGDMTAAAFLDFIAQIRGFDGAEKRRRVNAVVETVELGEVLGQSIETLSKGFKRRVGLAQAILHDPEVLILDEPTDGLDPNQKHQVRTLIHDMAANKAIIISTHILEEVEAVCSRAVIIANGRLLADGTAEELQARMPYHNAVAIKVSAGTAAQVRAEIDKLSRVGGVETLEDGDGSVRLRVLPKNNQRIAADVAELIKAKGFAIEELFIERGKLDDVFREITTGAKAEGGPHA